MLGKSQPSSVTLLPGISTEPGAACPKYREFRLAVCRCQVETVNCLLAADCGAGPPSAEAEGAPVAAKLTDSMATDAIRARSPADLRCTLNILLSFRFSVDVFLKSYCLCRAENTVSNVFVTNEIVPVAVYSRSNK